MTRRQRKKQRRARARAAEVQRAEFILRHGCSPEEWQAAKRIKQEQHLRWLAKNVRLATSYKFGAAAFAAQVAAYEARVEAFRVASTKP